MQERLKTNWLQNIFLQRVPIGLCEEVEHYLFIYDTICLLHLDLSTLLEQGNTENKQQKNLFQESITHLQVSQKKQYQESRVRNR